MPPKLLRNCGRALLGVFVVTVIAVLFPLNFQAPGWGQRLSTLIVDAASLPLVGLLLMRYAAHLDAEAANALLLKELATESSAHGLEEGEKPFDPFEEDTKMMRLARIAAPIRGIRQLAFKGFILLILVAIWQIFIAFSGLNLIDNQKLELSRQIDTRFQGVEQSIKVAPQEEIEKVWSQSQAKDNFGLLTLNPDPAAQRDEILKNVKGQNLQAFQTLQTQASTAQFNLARDVIRIMLMAIIYAWGFYGIAKL
jgi:hypothetical protein